MRHVLRSKYKKPFTALLAGLLLVSACPSPAHADDWNAFQDEDGIFHVLFPENYKLNKKMMRLTDTGVLVSTDLVATVDQRPYKDIVKDFAVRYDQTFAFSIAKNDIPALIDKDINKYIRYYKSIGGEIINTEQGSFAGRPGAEMIAAYKNDKGEVRTARIRVIYSDTTRLEQITVGPENYEAMFDHRTKDFFSSLQLKDGRTFFKGDAAEAWEEAVSPFEMFKLKLPKRAPPYVPARAQVTSNSKMERISLKLYDPVYDYTMFYNVYGYRFNSLMTLETVQKILMDRHLKKFKVDIRQIKFTQSANGQFPVLSTNLYIAAPEKYPFMNTIALNAYYYGPYLVVQESVGNNIHVESDISTLLMKGLEFTPAQAHKKQQSDALAAKTKGHNPESPPSPDDKSAPLPESDAPDEADDDAASGASQPGGVAIPPPMYNVDQKNYFEQSAIPLLPNR